MHEEAERAELLSDLARFARSIHALLRGRLIARMLGLGGRMAPQPIFLIFDGADSLMLELKMASPPAVAHLVRAQRATI